MIRHFQRIHWPNLNPYLKGFNTFWALIRWRCLHNFAKNSQNYEHLHGDHDWIRALLDSTTLQPCFKIKRCQGNPLKSSNRPIQWVFQRFIYFKKRASILRNFEKSIFSSKFYIRTYIGNNLGPNLFLNVTLVNPDANFGTFQKL